MSPGCLIVLNSRGEVVETFHGHGINGPWDMTALDNNDRALLFVTNVLNGNVVGGGEVDQGTVLRIALDVPEGGNEGSKFGSVTTIGSDFAEKADPDALVIGPTGVGLGKDDTLYVADCHRSRTRRRLFCRRRRQHAQGARFETPALVWAQACPLRGRADLRKSETKDRSSS